MVEHERRRLLGYSMVWIAAVLFAINGTVSKVILESGLSSLRLAQARSTGALIGLGVLLLLVARRAFRIRLRELPFLLVFGIAGVAFVQWFYFLAIHRLPIGIALLIQYLRRCWSPCGRASRCTSRCAGGSGPRSRSRCRGSPSSSRSGKARR